jgi:hypothetical protein
MCDFIVVSHQGQECCCDSKGTGNKKQIAQPVMYVVNMHVTMTDSDTVGGGDA